MGKHIIYNVLLNVGVVVLLYSAIAAYNAGQYNIMAFSIFAIVLLIYLKIRLLKKVKKHTRNRPKP